MKSINKRPKAIGPLDDKVIISSEYFEDDRPSYIHFDIPESFNPLNVLF